MLQKVMWRLAIVLILAIYLWIISPLPVAAQSVGEYFQLSYDPVSFNKSEIHGSEAFSATILGRATCIKDLPVTVSEVSITSRVVAKHAVSGTGVTLNSSYTISIKPFPSKKGETAEISQAVPLQFPAQAESGDYNVIGKLVEAKVKVGFAWVEVTGYIPQDQFMGSLKYIAPQSTPTPTPVPTPTLPPTPTPPPSPTPPEHGLAWWVWLIVAVAVATTVTNIIWFLRHRTT